MAIGRKGKWRHHRRMLAWAGSSLPKCWESYSRSSVARGWENANVLGRLLAPFSVRWTGGDWRETWASRLPVACLELYPRVSMGRVLNQNRITRILVVDGILATLTLMSRVGAGKRASMF
jgi:hypothetical protein